nr:MAG TPA: hypothetical protein [Caudoviricetes sp.]
MTINTLFLMSFLQGYEQLPHQDDVASVGTVGTAAARHIGVIHAGIEQDGLQCVCQFLRGVVRYHTGKRGHVVFRFHGSVLLCVKFHNILRLEVESGLSVVDAFLADAPVGERDALVLVFLGNVDDGLEYGIAHTVSAEHVLHVMERHVVPFCNLFQVGQRSVPAQDSLQLAEALTVFRGGKSAGVYQRAHVAAGEELDEMVVNNVLAYRVEPEGEIEGDVEVGTPCAGFVLGRIPFANDNLTAVGFIKSKARILATLAKFKFFIEFLRTIGKVLLCRFQCEPELRTLTVSIRLRHLGKVHHAVVDTLAGHRHFVSLNVEDFNQILIREHNYKNCDKKKSPRRCALHIYAGRMMQPIVSARPP